MRSIWKPSFSGQIQGLRAQLGLKDTLSTNGEVFLYHYCFFTYWRRCKRKTNLLKKIVFHVHILSISKQRKKLENCLMKDPPIGIQVLKYAFT